MNIVQEIFTNKCVIIPFSLWAAIQIIKFITDFIINKKINFKRLMGAGGMPSSHSAVVTSLAVCIGKQYGFNSGIFALSLIMAMVVMYDAAGIRRAAGKQASILNKIMETPEMTTLEVQEKLIEALGHTPTQVFVGALVGIIAGALIG